MARPDVIIVTGPTASGKSALALALAQRRHGTVINADAMQTYDAFPILTAQPSAAERAVAPHLLYGVLPVGETLSAARWRALAETAIERSLGEGRLPVLCGGSGLYLRALMQGFAEIPSVPAGLRAQANEDWLRLGPAIFRARLAEHDPEIVARLAPGDRQRHVRAWEVWQATGRPLSDWQEGQVPPAPWRFALILLAPERAWLRDRIAARFDAMLRAGMLDEVRAVFDRHPDPSWPGLKAHGAPELFRYFRGELTLEEARRIAIDHTRQYAKRQMTWFRHQLTPDLVVEACSNLALEAAEKFLDKIEV
ncbi:MAG: tRNA dimethylallyltransferase [Enhydrobacter sp.]|jgi:tRNA dimethylallyltransferase|nr:MAG: tRNA dimethylallyltransferase [Enhydrobacter sp.]